MYGHGGAATHAREGKGTVARGRNSLLSVAAFPKSQSVNSVLQLKITQASSKDITSDVTYTNTPKKSSTMGDAGFLQKSFFTLFGDFCDVCKFAGATFLFWPDRLTIEQDIEIFI